MNDIGRMIERGGDGPEWQQNKRGCDCCDPTADSPDPVVVRLENQVADLRNLVETATVLLKEACDSMDESVSKASDGRWYMKKMPSFINIDWQMRAIIWQANAGAKP